MENSKIQQKTSSILATIIIGLMILSFIFTGYFARTGKISADSAANVDGVRISFNEYQRQLAMRMRFYEQLTGGRGFSEKDMERMGLKDAVLNELIDGKLLLSWGEKIGLRVSPEEIGKEIREIPQFQNDSKNFDFDLYKRLLESNRLSIADFEKSIEEGIAQKNANLLVKSVPLSEQFLKGILEIKKNKLVVDAVEFQREALVEKLEISEAEMNAFLENKENQEPVKSHFDEIKERYYEPAMVKLRQIVVNVNSHTTEELEKILTELKSQLKVQNFGDLAKKYSDDSLTKNKGKGGEVGFVTKDGLDAAIKEEAFSLPVNTLSQEIKTEDGEYYFLLVEDKKDEKNPRIEDYTSIMNREVYLDKLEAKTKKEKIDILEKQVIEKVSTAYLQANNQERDKQLEQLQKDFPVTREKDVKLNPLEGQLGTGMSLSSSEIKQIFDLEEKGEVKKKLFTFQKGTGTVLVFADLSADLNLKKLENSVSENAISDDDLKKEKELQKRFWSQEFQTQFMKNLKSKAKIVKNTEGQRGGITDLDFPE